MPLAVRSGEPMIGHVKIRERGSTPRAMQKEMRSHLKEAWRDSGEHWHREIRPKHFTNAGFYEYGYTPRKPRYLARKRRQLGHTLPLVKSGLTRNLSRIRDVRSTSRGARVVIKAPTLRRQNPKSGINMMLEMRAISARDARDLATVHDGSVDSSLSRSQSTHEVTV